MTEVTGKLNELQVEEFDKSSPDNEISRLRIIEMFNFLSREAYSIGDIVESGLTYTQFRNEMDNTWTLMQGQNIQNSDLSDLLSVNVLPDLVGNQGMIGQANQESDLLDYQPGVNKAHTHGTATGSGDGDADNPNGSVNETGRGIDTNTERMSTSYQTDDGEGGTISFNRPTGNNPSKSPTDTVGTGFVPKSIKVNFFIKVNSSREWTDE